MKSFTEKLHEYLQSKISETKKAEDKDSSVNKKGEKNK